MKKESLVKVLSFFWASGVMGLHLLLGCLGSFLVFSSSAISIGIVLFSVLTLTEIEGGYLLYRKLRYNKQKDLGLLRYVWFLPRVIYQNNVKKKIEQKEEQRKLDEYLRQEGALL